jgi:DNA-binding NarL/FixJ family response regulator
VSVQVSVNLATSEYKALTLIANQRDIQAHVLVEQLIRHALVKNRPAPKPTTRYVSKPEPKRTPEKKRSDRDTQWVAVEKLHALGLNDTEIAATLGISSQTARRRRLQLHLPALTKPGRPKQTRNNNAATVAEMSTK